MSTLHAALDLGWSDLRSLAAGLVLRLSAVVRRRGPSRPSLARLAAASPAGRSLLRRLLAEETRTLWLPAVPGAAIGLELADAVAIYRSPETAQPQRAFMICLSPWAWEELRRSPELLDANAERATSSSR